MNTAKMMNRSFARLQASVVRASRLQGNRFYSSTSSTFSSAIASAVEPKFFVPRAERGPDRPAYPIDPKDSSRLIKTGRTCPTRELNYTHESWQKHKSPYRRFRHVMSIFRSSPFQRLIFPELTTTASVAAALAYYNEIIVGDPAMHLLADGAATAGATTAIGLLAAFRLNASYGRYDEGRKFWGEINNAARDLGGNAMMYIDEPTERQRMLKLIKAFPIVTQWHLNEKGGHFQLKRKDADFKEQKIANYVSELREVFKDDKDPDFNLIVNTYTTGGHVPLTVSAGIRRIIGDNHSPEKTIYNKNMDEQVRRLVACLGQCERVLRTPLPTCFTRHTSRLLFLWSNLLPFTLYSSLGPIAVIPGSLVVSYAIMGIADVGVQLEEPFNILPLRQYSEGIYDGINAIEKGYLASGGQTKL
jgi:putative membrane protein